MRRRVLLLPVLSILALAGCGGEAEPRDVDTTGSAPTGVQTAEDPADDTTGATADGAIADDVIAEVTEVAPELESFYRGGPYPQSLEEAVASLGAAGVTLLPGHQVGGYVYDDAATEFVLCLQDEAGAWASYDTAPMGVRDSGTSGGCPAA